MSGLTLKAVLLFTARYHQKRAAWAYEEAQRWYAWHKLSAHAWRIFRPYPPHYTLAQWQTATDVQRMHADMARACLDAAMRDRPWGNLI